MSDYYKMYTLTDEAFDYYRMNVKGNKFVGKDLAQRKVSRNIACAKEVKSNVIKRLLGFKVYHYGNLHIKTKGNKVIGLKNHRGKQRKLDWEFDPITYLRASDVFGVVDKKYYDVKRAWKRQAQTAKLSK